MGVMITLLLLAALYYYFQHHKRYKIETTAGNCSIFVYTRIYMCSIALHLYVVKVIMKCVLCSVWLLTFKTFLQVLYVCSYM